METILGYLAPPFSPAGQGSPEAVIQEQKVEEKTKEPIPSDKKNRGRMERLSCLIPRTKRGNQVRR